MPRLATRLGPRAGGGSDPGADVARRAERRDVARWGAAAVLLFGVGWLVADAAGTGFDIPAPPAGVGFEAAPSVLLAPLVAAGALLAAATGQHERLRWPLLLLAGFGVAAAWGWALAAPGDAAGVGHAADVAAVQDDPAGFLDRYPADAAALSPAARTHPPLPVLLLWAADRLGLAGRGAVLGLTVLAGALVVPLVAAAVRSLCGEPAARRLVPVLAVAPAFLWLAGSLDAVAAVLAAGCVAAGIVGGEPGRPWWSRVLWAAGSGVLLGLAVLCAYPAVWLAATVLCGYFVRRRPLLNAATGVGALLPIAAAEVAGFSWLDGFRLARAETAAAAGAGSGSGAGAAAEVLLGLGLLVLAGGPALAASARKVRLTPGWPLLAGAALGVVFAVAAGLAAGGRALAWLPVLPGLLVGAVAPERRGGPGGGTPTVLAGAGALATLGLWLVFGLGPSG